MRGTPYTYGTPFELVNIALLLTAIVTTKCTQFRSERAIAMGESWFMVMLNGTRTNGMLMSSLIITGGKTKEL